MQSVNRAISIFISYSHADEAYMRRLEKHLSLLKRNGHIAIWHDRRIPPGETWDEEISQHLQSSQLILFLVSSDFLASDYCYGIELNEALKMHREGFARVIPVIIRPVLWRLSPLARLQALPRDGVPVAIWENSDQAYVDIAEGILTATNTIGEDGGTSEPISSSGSFTHAISDGARDQNRSLTFELKLDDDFNELTQEKHEELVNKLRNLVADSHLHVVEIREGSIVVIIEGDQRSFRTITSLSKSGELARLLNMNVSDVFLSTGFTGLSEYAMSKVENALGLSKQNLDRTITTECNPDARCALSSELLHMLAELVRLTESVSEDTKAISAIYRILHMLDAMLGIISLRDDATAALHYERQLRQYSFDLYQSIEDLMALVTSFNRSGFYDKLTPVDRLRTFILHRGVGLAGFEAKLDRGLNSLLVIRKSIEHLDSLESGALFSHELREALFQALNVLMGVLPCLEQRVSQLLLTPSVIRHTLSRIGETSLSSAIHYIIVNLPHNKSDALRIWPRETMNHNESDRV